MASFHEHYEDVLMHTPATDKERLNYLLLGNSSYEEFAERTFDDLVRGLKVFDEAVRAQNDPWFQAVKKAFDETPSIKKRRLL